MKKDALELKKTILKIVSRLDKKIVINEKTSINGNLTILSIKI